MQSLIKFNDFVKEINKENGRLYKLSVLEKYKEDEDIKKYLQYVYDPFLIFGIGEKKLSKVFSSYNLQYNQIESTYDLLNYLLKNNTGSDENILVCQTYLNKLPAELKQLLIKIITKNLILGISGETINKVFGKNAIKTFSVQLANKYFDKPEIVEGKEFALTTKIDGMRCIAMRDNDKVSFWSRQGQEITGLVDLEQEMFKKLPNNICLDGELVAISDNPDTYKQTIKLARTKDVEKHGLKMKVFDCMTAEEFKNQYCPDDYVRRRTQLLDAFVMHDLLTYTKIYEGLVDRFCSGYIAKEELIKEVNKEYIYFEILPLLYKGNDTRKITEILDSEVAKGEEGIMINICDALYSFKRTDNLLKCKKFHDIELKIIGFEPGINKLSNTLGTLLCDYKGNVLGVGSGFTDEERNYIWNHQGEYLGKLAKVKYFEETHDAEGNLSLRFPVYLGSRLEEDR